MFCSKQFSDLDQGDSHILERDEPLIKWPENLELGIPAIDNQYRLTGHIKGTYGPRQKTAVD